MAEAIGKPAAHGVSDTIPVPLLGNRPRSSATSSARCCIAAGATRRRPPVPWACTAAPYTGCWKTRLPESSPPALCPPPLPLVLEAEPGASPAGVCS